MVLLVLNNSFNYMEWHVFFASNLVARINKEATIWNWVTSTLASRGQKPRDTVQLSWRRIVKWSGGTNPDIFSKMCLHIWMCIE